MTSKFKPDICGKKKKKYMLTEILKYNKNGLYIGRSGEIRKKLL